MNAIGADAERQGATALLLRATTENLRSRVGHACLRISLQRLRPLYRYAADGRVRPGIAVPGVQRNRAARNADGAALFDHVGPDASGPCRQRAQRTRAALAVFPQGVSWCGLHLLCGCSLTHLQTRKRRFKKLPQQTAVDDLALNRSPDFCRLWLQIGGRQRW